MPIAPRRVRAIAGLTVAVVAATSIAITAIRADGRPASAEETNDGGAWLLDRRASAVGHVNRASREVTGAVRVAEPGASFWIDQSAETVLVHDESTQSVSVVDGRTYATTATVPIGLDVDVQAVDGGIVLSQQEPLRTWRLPVPEFTALDADLADVEPTVSSTTSGLATTTPDDVTITVDATGAAHWIFPDDRTSEQALAVEDPLAAVTALGDDVVAITTADLLTSDPFGEPATVALGALPDEVAWQQPGVDAGEVVGTGAAGEVVALDRVTGEVSDLFALRGSSPVAPIVHRGCVFALVQEPAVFARQCGDDVLTVPLTEVASGVLEMRLVNGWVWINAVDTGRAWVVDEQSGLEEVDDVGSVFEEADEVPEEEPTIGESSRQRQDNDADQIGTADKQDDDGENEPPTANPDEVAGRADQPLLVQVLDNDVDPDGDVLLVTATTLTAGDARVEATADRRFVQVSPDAGFIGAVTFEYTIEDGRGGRDATTATVDVRPDDPQGNRAPLPETDFLAAAPSVPVTANVIDNDLDPDGDSLQVTDVTGDGGALVWAADGELTFTPDQASSGELDLSYTVADAYGAEAEGTVRVDVRTVEEANRAPDARNDSGTTAVDKPIVFNVLDNDFDPDGDRITVSGPAVPVTVPDGAGDTFVSLSPDGVFFIEPQRPGDYVYRYQVSDGGFNDIAQIRVRVSDPPENLPPVAVRDDAVIPLGATRVVQALRNDGDPDGDVLAITAWTGSEGLVVERIEGIGFRVTVLPTASPVELFTYEVSDGVNEPVFGTVVVTVSEASGEDQPPIAKPDVVEVQAGRSVAAPVLRNDFDPEGGSLAVVEVTDPDDARVDVGGGGQSVIVTLPEDARLGVTFGYQVEDEAGNQASTTVEVQVVQPGDENRSPIAVPDVATTLERTPVVIDVLANDSDPDGDPLQVESITAQPANGVARVLEDGTVEYVPAAGQAGTDRFAYSLLDARGARVNGQVLVGVMPKPPENRPPIAIGDQVEVEVGSGRAVVDVLANDVDPDGDRLVVTDTSDVGLGSVRLNQAGTAVVYSPPDALDPGQDRTEVAFRYSIDDGAGHQVDGTVRVTLVAEADPLPPVANDDQAGPVTAGERVVVDVLANDEDPDGEVADLEVDSDDRAVRVRPDGQVVITAGDTTRQVVYRVTDADGLSATAAVTVVVLDNRAPVVTPRQVEAEFDTPIEVDLTGQASDPDDDELLYPCCDQARGGAVDVLSPNANDLRVRFTPNPGFVGEGGFSFTVDDQHGHQVAASVVVVVAPPANTPPVVEDRAIDAEVGRSTTLDLQSLVSDEDPDDEHELAVSDVAGPMQVDRSGGRVVIDPEITATGETGSFVVTATDRAGERASGRVTVALTPSTLPPPVATADEATTNQGTDVTVPVLRNDIGDGLRLVDASSPQGQVSIAGDQVRFDPDPSFFGSAVVTYTIEDRQQTRERQATAQVRIAVIGFPGRPSAPQVVADSHEATLTWTAPPANGAPIESYVVQHDQGGEVRLGTTTTHQWNGLDNGTSYRFRVRATNSAGPSEWSEWSPAVVPNEEPGRPAAPTVTFGNRQLDVRWAEPANDGTAITEYELEIGGSTTGSRSIPPRGATTTHTWEDLDNGSEYQFRVRAVNAAGESPWSTWSTSEHPLTTPDAPQRPSVSTGPTYLDIDWNRPANGGDTIQRYQVQRRVQGDNASIASASVDGANTTAYRWGQLPSGRYFEFRVRAVNRAEPVAAGWSAWSAPARACEVPQQPQPPTVTRGDKQADVATGVPSTPCPITNVEFQHDQASGIYNAPSGSLTVSPLNNGTAYRFRARFSNEQRTGPWSGWSAAVTPAGPAQPPTAMSTSAITGESGGVHLTWNAGGDNGSPIEGYRVTQDGQQVANLGPNARQVDVHGLNPGRTYTFRVIASNDVGSGGNISRTFTAKGAPARIGSLSVNNSTRGQLTWNWNAPAGNGGGIDFYEVDRNANGNNPMRENNRNHTWGGLNDGVSKTIRVHACNQFGCANWSPGKTGTTKPPPPPDPSVTVSRGARTGVRTGCSSGRCHYANLALRDFAANTTYQRRCQFTSPRGGSISTTTSWQNVTVNGAGDWGANQIDCYMQGEVHDMRVEIRRGSTIVARSPWTTWNYG